MFEILGLTKRNDLLPQANITETFLRELLLLQLFLCYWQLLSSADNLCKQIGPNQARRRAWSGSKLFDTLMVFLKDFFFEKVNLKKNPDEKKHAKLTSIRRVKGLNQVISENVLNIFLIF